MELELIIIIIMGVILLIHSVFICILFRRFKKNKMIKVGDETKEQPTPKEDLEIYTENEINSLSEEMKNIEHQVESLKGIYEANKDKLKTLQESLLALRGQKKVKKV